MCISCIWPSLGVHFVCHMLLHLRLYCSDDSFRLSFCSFFGKVLPALGGKHNFASCFDVRSLKSAPLALPFRRKIASLTYNLHVEVCTIHGKNPNYRFGGVCRISKLVKSIGKMCISCLWPLLGAPFSIVCTFCMHFE